MFWIKRFLNEIDVKQEKYFVDCDSQSAIHLSKNFNFVQETNILMSLDQRCVRK